MKNKNKILQFQIFSVIFVIIMGILLHFTYEWSNENVIVGAFSAVNESTWEHLKLIYFPMLMTTIIGYFYLVNTTNNFLCAKLIGILISTLFIVIFFYAYTAILGNNVAVLDIGSFFIAVILGEYISYKILTSKFVCNTNLAIVVLIVLLVSFISFTYVTPRIFLFQDPINGGYGIVEKIY